VRVAERPAGLAAALAAVAAGERVAVVDPRFTGHRHSLRLGLTDPRFPAAAVPGAVSVLPAARGALAAAVALGGEGGADGAGGGEARGGPGATPTTTRAACLPDRIAERLAAAGTAVHRPELGPLVATVAEDSAARARAAVRAAEVDEEAVRLRAAVKSRDGFFTTHCVSPYSRYLARWCARRGLTPNQVTTASLLTALAAAGCAATGSRPGFVAAAVLLLGSFVLDCADGQLARYALRYSTLGAWLDATFDRAKEYAFYAGLALGAARGGDDVWGLALAAMVLQTCRHVVDFAFTEAHQPDGGAGRGRAALPVSDRLDRIGWTVWLRRMIVLPIGERWALIAVLTALTTPRTTLLVLLAAGGFAACYTTAGRLLRSRRAGRLPAPSAQALHALTDSGPLAETLARAAAHTPAPHPGPGWAGGRGGKRNPALALAGVALLLAVVLLTGGDAGWYALAAAAAYAACAGLAVAGPLDGPFDWLLPPLFRAGEYGCVLALAANAESNGKVNGALPSAFLLVAACAYHHYDTVYRLRGGAGAPPRWLIRATGGHEGRALAVTAAAALWAEGQGFTAALAVLGGALALVVLGESIRFWVSTQAPAVHDETGVPG
jgi:phosphatidylglycerophosphate synthase